MFFFFLISIDCRNWLLRAKPDKSMNSTTMKFNIFYIFTTITGMQYVMDPSVASHHANKWLKWWVLIRNWRAQFISIEIGNTKLYLFKTKKKKKYFGKFCFELQVWNEELAKLAGYNSRTCYGNFSHFTYSKK